MAKDPKTLDDATRDACLIAGCQRAEHYEIAVYGTLVSWADTLGTSSAVGLLQQTLEEEKDADQTLSRLAVRDVNLDAAEV